MMLICQLISHIRILFVDKSFNIFDIIAAILINSKCVSPGKVFYLISDEE